MANNDNGGPKKEKPPRLCRALFTGGDLERKKEQTTRTANILIFRPPPSCRPQTQSRSPSESSYAGFNSLKSEAFWFTGDSDTLGHVVHFPPIAPTV